MDKIAAITDKQNNFCLLNQANQVIKKVTFVQPAQQNTVSDEVNDHILWF